MDARDINQSRVNRPRYYTFHGTTARFLDPRINIRFVVSRHSDGVAFTDFQFQSQGELYAGQRRRLERLGNTINDLYERGEISLSEKNQRLRDEFIPSSEQFVNDWGLHMVVWESRKLITQARLSIGLPNIKWPPINLFLAWGPDSDCVTTPGLVDEFGRVIFDQHGQVVGATVSMKQI